jgi:hypothetical protein
VASASLVGVSVCALGAVAALLLSAAFGDFTGRDASEVWVNPNWARAGIGFAVLTLCLAGAAVEAVARRRPLNQGPSTPAGYAVVVGLALVVGLSAWQAGPITTAYAALHGFGRCPSHDRFTRGNSPRNDVVKQAYLRTRDLDATCSSTP